MTVRTNAGRLSTAAVIGLAISLASVAASADDAMPANDLRGLRVGQAVGEIPTGGVKDLACAGVPDIKLASWADYSRCPINTAGYHAVAFRYDAEANPLSRISEDGQGTKVAGQPVTLQLLIGDDAVMHGLLIATDPAVRLYAHRRAYLFGLQAKARYGEDGWECAQKQPTPTEQPIGTSFVKEHCEKAGNGRRYIVDRDLHHDPAKDISQFVSSSSVLILDVPVVTANH
jgi:hypothetical protein